MNSNDPKRMTVRSPSSLHGRLPGKHVIINTYDTGIAQIALPATGVSGRIYVLKNRALTHTATLGFLSGSSLIDGSTTLSVPINGTAVVICDGTNWYKIN